MKKLTIKFHNQNEPLCGGVATDEKGCLLDRPFVYVQSEKTVYESNGNCFNARFEWVAKQVIIREIVYSWPPAYRALYIKQFGKHWFVPSYENSGKKIKKVS